MNRDKILEGRLKKAAKIFKKLECVMGDEYVCAVRMQNTVDPEKSAMLLGDGWPRPQPQQQRIVKPTAQQQSKILDARGLAFGSETGKIDIK